MTSTPGDAVADADLADTAGDSEIWMDYEIVEKVVDKRIGKNGKTGTKF